MTEDKFYWSLLVRFDGSKSTLAATEGTLPAYAACLLIGQIDELTAVVQRRIQQKLFLVAPNLAPNLRYRQS